MLLFHFADWSNIKSKKSVSRWGCKKERISKRRNLGPRIKKKRERKGRSENEGEREEQPGARSQAAMSQT